MKKQLLAILLLLQAGLVCFSQEPEIYHYREGQGFPSFPCNFIMQDSQGWMWFSASYEVLRYDGHHFKSFHPANGVELHSAFKLMEINQQIWVQATPYFLRVDGDSLRKLVLSGYPQSTIQEIRDAIRYGNEEYLIMSDGLYKLRNNQLEPYIITPQSLTDYNKSCVFNDTLVIAHEKAKGRIFVFNMLTKQHFLSSGSFSDIEFRNGHLFVAKVGDGIHKATNILLNDDAAHITTRKEVDTDLKMEGFNVDLRGNFWLFDRQNHILFAYRENVHYAVIEKQLDERYYVTSFVDRENNLWIGPINCVLKLPELNWNRYTVDDKLASNRVKMIERGFRSGQVFIQTNKGLNVFENGRIKTVTKHKLPLDARMIKKQGREVIYLIENRLYRAKVNEAWETSNERTLLTLPTPVISIVYDARSNLYIGCHDGLYYVSNGTIEKISNKVYKALYISRDKILWAGQFNGGLDGYTIEGSYTSQKSRLLFQIDTINERLPRVNAIRTITEDTEGRIAVGTRYNGLFIIDIENEKIQNVYHLNGTNGLRGNHVWDLSIDDKGVYWVATSGGINSITNKGQAWMVDEGGPKVLAKGVESILADNGKIWANSYPGFILFDPYKPMPHYPFSVFITGTRVNGRSIMIESMAGLKPEDDNIEIQFSANSFRYEDQILFTWRLSKNDRWSPLSPAREVLLSRLKPGQYRFEAKAKDAFGRWSENKIAFNFSILPAIWQRWWFILLSSITFLLITFSVYKYRAIQTGRLERLRAHIARDLHDEIGSTLSSISILSRVSKSNLDRDISKTEGYLDNIIGQSQKMQQNMRDIIWAIKPDNDRISNMTSRMREFVAYTLEPLGIITHFDLVDIDGQRKLTMKTRRDLFLIFKEAIHNVAQHSGATEVTISLRVIGGCIYLRIVDNGIGITYSNVQGNGLQNMKNRTADLGGQLDVRSCSSMGCCVELQIPFK